MNSLFDIRVLVLLILSLSYFGATSQPPCGYNQSVNITGAIINDQGTASFEGQEYLIGSYGYFNDSFFGVSTNIDENEVKTHLRGCYCDLPGKPCLFVCCPVGYIKRKKYGPCYPNKLPLYANTSNSENNYTTIKVEDNYRMVQRDPCPYDYERVYQHWKILENGTLHSDVLVDNKFFVYGDFCIDPVVMDNSTIETNVYVCYTLTKYSQNYFANIHEREISVLTRAMIFSIIFLTLTLSIYAIVPELRNLHGKLLMCYMGAIIVYYTFSAVDTAEILANPTITCTIVGNISYGSSLMSLFFLNAISADYFTAFYFKDYRTANKFKLFRWYMFLSVGATLFLVCIAAPIDTSGINRGIQHRPKIGPESCLLHSKGDREGNFIFFYLFMTLTLFVSTVLFVITALKMRRIKKTRTMSKIERKNYDDQMERETFFHLLLMLLFVNYTWAMDLFFWYMDVPKGLDVIALYGFQCYEYLQGFWLFVICILKCRTLALIAKRWSNNKNTRVDTDENIQYLRAGSE